MEQIIAGRFQTKDQADVVADRIARYVLRSDICIFHNNPQGQHDAARSQIRSEDDPGSADAPGMAAGGALVAGLAGGAVGLFGGPTTALAGAAAGAYVGAFAGAMHGMGDNEAATHPMERRPGGVMLSVRIANESIEHQVIASLREGEARDIERASGTWRDGDWVDYNPVEAPQLIALVTI